MSEERSDISFIARLYHEIYRGSEATEAINKLAYLYPDFDEQELKLFFSIYKDSFDSLRQTMKILKHAQKSEFQEKQRQKCLILQTHLQKTYQKFVDLAEKCSDVIDNNLLKAASSPRTIAFLQKMKADIYRYLSECSSADTIKENIKKSKELYTQAMETCTQFLHPYDSLCMDTILNLAVFEYQHTKDQANAIELLRNEIEKIKQISIDDLDEEQRENIMKILSIMETNYSAWTGI
ncbi:14-3-3 protein [Histomonas meleagridis]|uniref:14-3-3 protein n=1 Tax=Histomonas meleagridis TaxID=135588 RepID=UPI003559D3A4|nr:14-3-3 protein [Histomonas meleagridis]